MIWYDMIVYCVVYEHKCIIYVYIYTSRDNYLRVYIYIYTDLLQTVMRVRVPVDSKSLAISPSCIYIYIYMYIYGFVDKCPRFKFNCTCASSARCVWPKPPLPSQQRKKRALATLEMHWRFSIRHYTNSSLKYICIYT